MHEERKEEKQRHWKISKEGVYQQIKTSRNNEAK